VAVVSDEVEGLDEEFVFHLTRGAQALGRGEVEESRLDLERALTLRPRDPKVLGLLGQAFYRQGQFEQAAVAWQRLVDDNPVEAGARVNLGLACLKARRLQDAVRQLEIALDLHPDHKKAMGYLGLALLESGDAARARSWFAKAGSEQMVARCDELIAAQADAVAAAPAPAPEPVHALAPLLTGGVADQPVAHDASAAIPTATPTSAPTPTSINRASNIAAHPERRAATGGPESREAPTSAPTATATPAPPLAVESASLAGLTAAPTLAAWAAERVLQPHPLEPFAADGPALAAAVKGELLCRLDGLLAWRGDLTFTGEVKRFRGRATDKPFGEGAEQVHRLSGEGLVLLRVAGRRFTVLDLGGEAGFFREPVVFGFEEPVTFENGRLASPAGDVDLVHLRGRGRIVLRTAGEPLAIEVTPTAPVRVPIGALVGWVGTLTPRLVPPLEGGAVGGAVDLTGEGRVLVDGGRADGEGR
jgi:uncharacterized protein (AIM24 family)/thioredoxin-like negative regulator of GroEL